MYKRTETRPVYIKGLQLGGNNKVYIQSMTTTKTSDVAATVAQIHALERAGCEIVRVACLTMEDAKAIGRIKKQITIPIVADIHYNPTYALEAIKQGVDKIRINPANIGDQEGVKKVVLAAKEAGIPIRIGVNSGSFKSHDNIVEQMLEYAQKNIDLLTSLDFHDIVLSFKSTNLRHVLDVNRLAAARWPYPLHIGMTEAGTMISGSVKNAIGIGNLLLDELGNTIRVSITVDPVEEIKVCKEILKNFDLYDAPTIIACPTCGRLQYDMFNVVNEVENRIQHLKKKITIAVMGCSVNGPGESKMADIGIAGGKGEVLLYKYGEVIRKIPESEAVDVLVAEIESMQ